MAKHLKVFLKDTLDNENNNDNFYHFYIDKSTPVCYINIKKSYYY